MDIPLNVIVQCMDGEAGHSVCVIVDPIKDQITHLVVKEKGLVGMERLVPAHFILETSPNRIRLNCSLQALEKTEIFTESEFIPYPGEAGFTWPFYPIEEGLILEQEKIPSNELAIRRGDTVNAVDGPIGRVDEFLVEPKSDLITHLVMREGHLWGQKDVTIPVSQIDHIESDAVYLKLTKKEVELMPSLPVKRRG